MKKRFVIIVIAIIVSSFGLIAFFTKFIYSDNAVNNKKVTYLDIKNSVESVEYYLYELNQKV